jgi:dTDP-4-dehydrorhamnose 3,5-epimerase
VGAYYDPVADRSLLWNDPAFGIDWPVILGAGILSDKDRVAPLLAKLAACFQWQG